LRKRALAERTKSNTLLSRAKCQVQNKYPFTLLPIYQLPTASGKLKIGKSLKKKTKVINRKTQSQRSHQDYRAIGLRKKRSKNENQKVTELCSNTATHNNNNPRLTQLTKIKDTNIVVKLSN